MGTLLNRSKLFINRNGGTILTVIGGVGVVATTIMAVKATPKAVELLEQAKQDKGDELTKLEIVKVAGPVYIPTIITGASTIACIFGANKLNKRQQASLMSAYALLDSSYKDHKRKVTELYGEDANHQVSAEIAKEKYAEEGISTRPDKILFYDDYSGRYFESTMEDVIKAQYAINRAISERDGASINEWFLELDMPPMEYGDSIGWSGGMLNDYQWSKWLDFTHKKVLIDDDLECIIITFSTDPLFDFQYY